MTFRECLNERLRADALALVNLTVGMGSADNAEAQRLARHLCRFRDGQPVAITSDGWSSRAIQFLIGLDIARRDPAKLFVLNVRACSRTDEPLLEWNWN